MLGGFQSPNGSGDSRRDGGLCAESSGCAESPAGTDLDDYYCYQLYCVNPT